MSSVSSEPRADAAGRVDDGVEVQGGDLAHVAGAAQVRPDGADAVEPEGGGEVQPVDLVLARGDPAEVRAQEAGGAGDQELHAALYTTGGLAP